MEISAYINIGVLEVSDGKYRITAKGEQRIGEQVAYNLKTDRSRYSLSFLASDLLALDGVTVGSKEEILRYTRAAKIERQWSCGCKALLPALSDSDKQSLGVRVSNPPAVAARVLSLALKAVHKEAIHAG